MSWSTRGLPPLEEVCEKAGVHAAFRLRGEYLPGPAPFPESPEEAEWLARRESLAVTVLATPAAPRVLVSWSRGGEETSRELPLAAPEHARLAAALAQAGAWTLAAFGRLQAPPGTLEFEHEAYAYHEQHQADADAESLDLEGWSPPRRWKVEKAGSGASADAALALIRLYRPFLPPELAGREAWTVAFGG